MPNKILQFHPKASVSHKKDVSEEKPRRVPKGNPYLPKPDIIDVTVLHFAQVFVVLEADTPVLRELDRWGFPKNLYADQKEHMIDWYLAQTEATDSGKKYTRKEANYSGRVTYDRLRNPGSLLWIAEAFGEDEQTLRTAVEWEVADEKAHRNNRGIGFRQIITFDRILDLYRKPEGWLYDQEAVDWLTFDKRYGMPTVKRGLVRKFEEKFHTSAL